MHRSSGLEAIGNLKGFHSITPEAVNNSKVPMASAAALGAANNTNVLRAT